MSQGVKSKLTIRRSQYGELEYRIMFPNGHEKVIAAVGRITYRSAFNIAVDWTKIYNDDVRRFEAMVQSRLWSRVDGS